MNLLKAAFLRFIITTNEEEATHEITRGRKGQA